MNKLIENIIDDFKKNNNYDINLLDNVVNDLMLTKNYEDLFKKFDVNINYVFDYLEKIKMKMTKFIMIYLME